MTDLIELPINTTTTREVKEYVVKKVNENPLNPFYQKLDATLMRFREKTVDKITKVYIDNEFLERYSMFEGKEIAIQILKEPELVL